MQDPTWTGQYIPKECQECNRLRQRGEGVNQAIEDRKRLDRFTAQQGLEVDFERDPQAGPLGPSQLDFNKAL